MTLIDGEQDEEWMTCSPYVSLEMTRFTGSSQRFGFACRK